MERTTFIGEDGILHCSVCGAAVEKILPFPTLDGKGTTVNKKVGVMCICQKQEKEEYERRQKQSEDMLDIKRLRKISLMEEKLKNANLSVFTQADGNKKLFGIIRNYILNFDRMYENNQGLLFWGPVGTGKSYAAAVIANELLDRKVSVIMTSFIKILKEVGAFNTDSGKIEKINNAKLLIIDDLGAERGTDYALEIVYDIIDSRYRSNKPIILTTNLMMEQMKECEDIRYSRIYDRVFEMCYPVKVTGTSWRKKEAASKYYETKKILEG